MKSYNGKDEEMGQVANGDQQHPFLSFAKQVSFPNWNVMVGELGEKFTRRSSIDKENTDCNGNIADETNENCEREATEQDSKSRLDWYPKTKQSIAEGGIDSLCGGDVSQGGRGGARNLGDVALEERKQIYRHCEMIKEESKESDEEIRSDNNYDEENRKNSYVSTVNIRLQKYKTPTKIKITASTMNTDAARVELGEGEHNSSMNHIANGSTTGSNSTRLRRAAAFDESHLAPLSIEATARENKSHKHKGRLRKKSSSFSGALPLRFPTTTSYTEEYQKEDSLKKSPMLGKRHVRRRGTIDMGRIESSAKISNHVRHKRADPSHYLMQNMGKRRGSYNPTYDQSNLKLNKSKKNNARTKSMFIMQDEEKQSLRERLMQHASPELRESLELSENNTDGDRSPKYDHIRHDKHTNYNKGVSPSELTRRKISLSKSASFTSYVALMKNTGDEKTSKEKEHDSHSLVDSLELKKRSIKRRTGVILPERNLFDANNVHQHIHKSTSDSEKLINHHHNHDHQSNHNRLHVSRARNARAQSSFDGVTPTYLGRLRQANAQQLKLDRTKSDSMSSISSSEGSDVSLSVIADPFPMHSAAKQGRTKLLQKLITSGKNVNAFDADGWPPIHHALTGGHFECVACLLNAGASITNYAKERTSKYFR
eukprot:gene537-1190_t